MKTKLFLIITLTAIASTFGCVPAKPIEAPPKSVKVKTVELISSQSSQRYSASIAPQTQVDVAFKSGGYVAAVSQVKGSDGRTRDLQAGDVVLKGAALAHLRAADYQVKVDQAKAQAAQAHSSLDSSQSRLSEANAGLEA